MVNILRNALVLRWGAYIALSRSGSFTGCVVQALITTLPFWLVGFTLVVLDINSIIHELALGPLAASGLGLGVGFLCLLLRRPAMNYLLSDVMLMRMLAKYDHPNDHYCERLIYEISNSGRYPVKQVEEFFLYRNKNKVAFREVSCEDWRNGKLYQVMRQRIERSRK